MFSKMIRRILLCLVSVLLPVCVSAQAPESAPKKPDSPEAAAHVAKAKEIAGKVWADEAHFLCEAAVAPGQASPAIEPTKLFDNLYAWGHSEVVAYAITTPDGIITIDAGYANDVDRLLLPAFKKLGLDPAKIKYAIITHGHADHFGGAFYLQEHYNTHIAMSALDWDMILAPPANGKKNADANPLPHRDAILAEGQPITFGGETLTPVFIPGHTPGSMGLIFPVKDEGKTHMAGIFGAAMLVPGRTSIEGLQQYLRSLEHFKQKAQEMKVDVELQNHPPSDDMAEKMMALGTRKPGTLNPFVVGEANYSKFIDVMSECMQAVIARKKE